MMTASVAMSPVHSERRRRRRFNSQLLGDVIVPEEQVLQFADGLFGFTAQREWVMIAAGRPGWCWLHAVDHPALAFLLVDPFEAFPDFGVELTTHDLKALGVTSATQVGIFAIVTLPLADRSRRTSRVRWRSRSPRAAGGSWRSMMRASDHARRFTLKSWPNATTLSREVADGRTLVTHTEHGRSNNRSKGGTPVCASTRTSRRWIHSAIFRASKRT